ncbi:kynurenine 3-monooxygenase, mitochondrial precursor [Emydomyces testavorans]|uniref:Kynurenine 3-monooxygenase n=1 Tax=Emydomyces testavorans TaxID=2070801 RepID=A0AAF0DLI7_9EURO|nr:kynurenine 3-monooxygenase, mitochondrial precursor [Emydomyces testavorans]
MPKQSKVVIVGAGPVGSLAALYAAARGDDVELYELRGDLRDPSTIPLNFTKSINLAISERGIHSMKSTNRPEFVQQILQKAIPMHGRMIHGRASNGTLWEDAQAYDIHGRHINAIDRGTLNTILLNELEKTPNVKLFFDHKLTGADFKNNKAWFERRSPGDSVGTFKAASNQDDKAINVSRAPELEVPFDFLIGADGAHSATRFHLMKFARMDYQQEYIDTLWCEFQIKPSEDNNFRISPNHLHIWPGREFMFIALPSPDKSFTCTLFAPSAHYVALEKSPDKLHEFFNTYFPGVSPELISPESLREQFMNNPHLPLISIKCSPHHFNSSVVILGDASHAVLPFYGQGLNAGLEDVRILFELLDQHGIYSPENANKPTRVKELRAAALDAYTRQRVPDAHAINELSRRNYIEMRWSVKSTTYRIRKAVEEALYQYAPGLGWSTQYARISFGNQRYSEVEKATARQSKVLIRTLGAMLFSAVGLVGLWMWRWRRVRALATAVTHGGVWIGGNK